MPYLLPFPFRDGFLAVSEMSRNITLIVFFFGEITSGFWQVFISWIKIKSRNQFTFHLKVKMNLTYVSHKVALYLVIFPPNGTKLGRILAFLETNIDILKSSNQKIFAAYSI